MVNFSLNFDPLFTLRAYFLSTEVQGVIKVGTLAKIRRLFYRDGVAIKEIQRRTGLSRNTIKRWLREPEMVEPGFPTDD